MKLSRRGFLKLTGTATAAATLTSLSLQGDSVVEASSYPVRLSYAKEVTSICTFCGVGCSILYHVRDGVIINAEGDPDSPVNEGALCPKGGSIYNLSYMYEEKGKPVRNLTVNQAFIVHRVVTNGKKKLGLDDGNNC